MKCVQYEIEAEEAFFVPLSDIHIGDKNFLKDEFLGYVRWIAETPNAFTFLNGDVINLATSISASSTFDQEGGLQWQMDTAVQYLYEIRHKIIGCLAGNHEMRLEKISGYNPMTTIALRLQIPYLEYSGILDIDVINPDTKKRQNYQVYAHHTTGGGGHTPGNKMNRINLLRTIVPSADIYIGSHNHHLGVMPVLRIDYDKKKNEVVEKEQWLVDTGHFLGWHDGYAEAMQLSPSKSGAPKIRLQSARKDIHVSL